MLYFETIDTPTLGLLKKLMVVPLFHPLRLVGGTSLALQIGHRKSVDLDLFGNVFLEELEIKEALDFCDAVTWLNKSKNIKSLLLNGIKTDIINYSYPWIGEIQATDECRLAHITDIAAMKLAAITGRGAKKDFVDLYFLLQTFSLAEMMAGYRKKYADGSEFLVLKSLIYFEDAEEDEMPQMLVPVLWDTVKEFISEQQQRYLTRL